MFPTKRTELSRWWGKVGSPSDRRSGISWLFHRDLLLDRRWWLARCTCTRMRLPSTQKPPRPARAPKPAPIQRWSRIPAIQLWKKTSRKPLVVACGKAEWRNTRSMAIASRTRQPKSTTSTKRVWSQVETFHTHTEERNDCRNLTSGFCRCTSQDKIERPPLRTLWMSAVQARPCYIGQMKPWWKLIKKRANPPLN